MLPVLMTPSCSIALAVRASSRCVQRREQPVGDRRLRGEVDHGGGDVVGGLALVDVIVGVDRVFLAERVAQESDWPGWR